MHHGNFQVPPGDIVVHCGDSTRTGKIEEIKDFTQWFAALPHRTKILIAGNHDFGFQLEPELRHSLPQNIIYLQDQAVEVEGLKFYGSPWQPRFYNWAFNLDRGVPLRQVWDRVPEDTQVLLTHGPPFGILDMTQRGEPVGDEELRRAVFRLPLLKLHVFGHIHESYGLNEQGGTKFVNAALCDLRYRPVHAPVVIDL